MVNVWSTYGQRMVNVWSTYGQCMVSAHGQCLVNIPVEKLIKVFEITNWQCNIIHEYLILEALYKLWYKLCVCRVCGCVYWVCIGCVLGVYWVRIGCVYWMRVLGVYKLCVCMCFACV